MQEADRHEPAAPWRVMVVEDDPVLRLHLSSIVGSAAGFALTGAAGSLAEARALIAQGADLVLLDLGLPDGSGVDLITGARQATDGCRILVITVFEDRASVVGAVKAGADGYILKDTTSDQILDLMRATMRGEAPISARAAGHLLSLVRDEPPTADPEGPTLAPREKQTLELLARGLSRKEAARAMDISPHTVAEYIQSIYRKLSVNSRSEAIFEALQNRMIRLDGL